MTQTVHEEHALATLLTKRMISHPEEFTMGYGRWHEALDAVREWGTDEDKAMVLRAYGKLRMDHACEQMMDELLNGDARRAQEVADKAAAYASQQRHTLPIRQGALGQAQSYYDQQNLFNQLAGQGLLSTSQTLPVGNGGTSATTLAGIQAASIKLGNTSLDETTLRSLLKNHNKGS